MQTIHVYLLVYGLPIFILFLISIVTYSRNKDLFEGRLLTVSSFSFICAFCGEFARQVTPLSFNPTLSKVIIGPSIVFGMITMVHFVYILLIKNTALKLNPIIVYAFYIPFAFQLYMSFSPFAPQHTHYIREGNWTYRVAENYNFWAQGLTLFIMSLLFFMLIYGYMKTTYSTGHKLITYLLTVFTILNVGYYAVLNTWGKLYVPLPILYLCLLIIMMLYIGIAHFHLLPTLQQRYKLTFELTPSAIIIIDKNFNIVEMNHYAAKILMPFNKRTPINLFQTLQYDFNHQQFQQLIARIQKQQQVINYMMHITEKANGEMKRLSIDATYLTIGRERYYYIMWRDVTEDYERDQLIEYLAYHDSLTGLYNRAYFTKAVDEHIQQAHELPFAFVLLDLNFFKQINDQYGHHIGDEVLQHVANILKVYSAPETIIARLGGDEFTLFLPCDKQNIEQFIDDLRFTFTQQLYIHQSTPIEISPSIGYSITREDGHTFEQLFPIADERMYADKRRIKALGN